MSVDPRYPAVHAERYGLPDPTRPCVCGHPGTVHDIGTRHGEPVRTACSVADPGRCGCRMYEATKGEPR